MTTVIKNHHMENSTDNELLMIKDQHMKNLTRDECFLIEDSCSKYDPNYNRNCILYAKYIAFCKSIAEFSNPGDEHCKLTKTKFSEVLLNQMPDFFNNLPITNMYNKDFLCILLSDPSFVKDLVAYAKTEEKKEIETELGSLCPIDDSIDDLIDGTPYVKSLFVYKIKNEDVESKYEKKALKAAYLLIRSNLQYSMSTNPELHLNYKRRNALEGALKTGIKNGIEAGMLPLNDVNMAIALSDTSDKNSMKPNPPVQPNVYGKPLQKGVKNVIGNEVQKKYATEFNDYLNNSNIIDLSRPLIKKGPQYDLKDDDYRSFFEGSNIEFNAKNINVGSYSLEKNAQSFEFLGGLHIEFKPSLKYLCIKNEAIKKIIEKNKIEEKKNIAII